MEQGSVDEEIEISDCEMVVVDIELFINLQGYVKWSCLQLTLMRFLNYGEGSEDAAGESTQAWL